MLCGKTGKLPVARLFAILVTAIALSGNCAAQQTAVPPGVAAELEPNLEAGHRLLGDLSEEAQKIRRQQLM